MRGGSWASSRRSAWSGSRAARAAGRATASASCASRASRSSGWSRARAARLYPSLGVDDLAFGLLEPAAGVLRAGDGVRALVARARGGRAARRAGRGAAVGERATVGDRVLEADHVVWACGAWLAEAVPLGRPAARDAPGRRALRRRARVGGRPGLDRLRRERLRPRAGRAARPEGRVGPRGRGGGARPAPAAGARRQPQRRARLPGHPLPGPGERAGALVALVPLLA